MPIPIDLDEPQPQTPKTQRDMHTDADTSKVSIETKRNSSMSGTTKTPRSAARVLGVSLPFASAFMASAAPVGASAAVTDTKRESTTSRVDLTTPTSAEEVMGLLEGTSAGYVELITKDQIGDRIYTTGYRTSSGKALAGGVLRRSCKDIRQYRRRTDANRRGPKHHDIGSRCAKRDCQRDRPLHSSDRGGGGC